MDWMNGLQKALNYIEDNITEELDYDEIARISYSSSYHFQRVFNILCGYTLGEYIRNRRLTLAGTELAADKIKVIDAAIKYGYSSPDSFTKSFTKFHGITPSAAREPGARLRSFARLSIKLSLEGGYTMDYRIEEKEAMTFIGYKRHFSGTPAERVTQEHDFYITTRSNQYLLQGLAHDCDTQYNVMNGFTDDGYEFYIASKPNEWAVEHLSETLGEDARRFEKLDIPAGLYLICETERTKYPTRIFEDLRRRAVSEWLPSSEYQLADAPELSVVHWFYNQENPSVSNSRYIELWLPIEKKA